LDFKKPNDPQKWLNENLSALRDYLRTSFPIWSPVSKEFYRLRMPREKKYYLKKEFYKGKYIFANEDRFMT